MYSGLVGYVYYTGIDNSFAAGNRNKNQQNKKCRTEYFHELLHVFLRIEHISEKNNRIVRVLLVNRIVFTP